MQQDGAKQKTKFHLMRTLGAWALVPGLGVPATKFVESYYDVSFFSLAISGMWRGIQSVGSWMNLTVSLPLWMLVLVTVLALLMMGVVVWVIIDANGKLKDADMGLDAAHAKIEDLQVPKIPPLTDEQSKVIAAIAAYDSVGKDCRTKDFPVQIGLTLLQADGAMDVLEKRKFISFQYTTSGKYVTLTAAGREYVLRPEFEYPLVPLPQAPLPGNGRI